MKNRHYDLSGSWTFSDGAAMPFRPVAVPGDVNAALAEHGDLPDPFVGLQFRAYFPNSAKSWVFRREFDRPEFQDNAELVFDGITGAAEIFLNGEKIGEARNAHRPHRFEVGAKLRERNNLLEVRFEPIEKSVGAARRDAFGWGNERTFLRTPPFNFGWDWSVPVPATGLSGAVRLECDNALKLVNVNYRTPELGRADFFIESSRAARDAGYRIHLHVWGHGADVRETLSSELAVPRWAIEEGTILSQHRVFATLRIPDAKYWWSNGLGEAALYDYEVELEVNGEIADRFRGRLGFRTVRIVEFPFRKEHGPGFSYEFELNGERVFIKGANWVPVSLWPATATEEQYRRLLALARDAHFNMLRVWGGGVYERDLFYDLCDEYGIMVWQDFMFASNAYPLGLLREEIKLEAEYQLKRLRLHPCIAQWCGINEDVFSWAYPGCGRLKGVVQADLGDYSGTGNWQFHDDPELYGMILRGMTGQMGNGVPYTESSPQSHGDCGNLPQSGNCHFNCSTYVRKFPKSFREHFAQICSFDSEFAQQGPDTAENTKRFLGLTGPVAWPPADPELWEAHIQRAWNEPLWARQADIAGKLFGEVESFEDFIRKGQASHFELTRCEYEYYRASRPDCGGTMMWMFNDCWPTGSWAQVNYFGEAKSAYYAARRFSAPQLPIVVSRSGKVEFAFDDQTFTPRLLHYTYGLAALSGKIKWVKEGTAYADANALTVLDVHALDDDVREAGDHYFLAVEGFDTTRCFADGWLDVPWPEAEGRLEQLPGGKIKVTAVRGYLRLAHLAPRTGGVRADLSDNFFDLAEGESRVVATALPAAELKLLHWRGDWE